MEENLNRITLERRPRPAYKAHYVRWRVVAMGAFTIIFMLAWLLVNAIKANHYLQTQIYTEDK